MEEAAERLMRRFQTGPSGQFATHHSGWSRAKRVPRLATAIFEDRAPENPRGTRVSGLHAGWLVSLPKAAKNDLAAVLSPAEARAMLGRA